MKSMTATFVMAAPEFDIECANCGHEFDRPELKAADGWCPACSRDPAVYDPPCDEPDQFVS